VDRDTRLERGRQGDFIINKLEKGGLVMAKKIVSHTDFDVYRKSFDVAMQVFDFSKRFPKEETYSLTDQIRRASRSVSANLGEAWRKRRYEAAFVSKLNDSESEAAETQVWLEFAVKCGYLDRDKAAPLYQTYDEVLRMVVAMISDPDKWLIK
jgi:four helix bundle protein